VRHHPTRNPSARTRKHRSVSSKLKHGSHPEQDAVSAQMITAGGRPVTCAIPSLRILAGSCWDPVSLEEVVDRGWLWRLVRAGLLLWVLGEARGGGPVTGYRTSTGEHPAAQQFLTGPILHGQGTGDRPGRLPHASIPRTERRTRGRRTSSPSSVPRSTSSG
jgi:hypothetical protein